MTHPGAFFERRMVVKNVETCLEEWANPAPAKISFNIKALNAPSAHQVPNSPPSANFRSLSVSKAPTNRALAESPSTIPPVIDETLWVPKGERISQVMTHTDMKSD
jgi:hypothetical protein